MVFGTRVAQIVYKTTGGRLWNKPWGVARLSKTQKENRRKKAAFMKANSDVLKAAAAREAVHKGAMTSPTPGPSVGFAASAVSPGRQ
eukprot:scaffold649737_cov45-Prasinocladus_malaysianus.AAC.1